MDFDYKEDKNELTVIDLLADVLIYPDGFVKVVDLDELVQASDEGRLSTQNLKSSLLKLNRLLTIIYAGEFPKLRRYVEELR